MVAVLVNRSIAIQDGQKQKARQGKEKIMNKGNFLKFCSLEIFFLTGRSQKKNMLSEETAVVSFRKFYFGIT